MTPLVVVDKFSKRANHDEQISNESPTSFVTRALCYRYNSGFIK
jgi:hypothetical protein